jgi:hypothetical protein
MFFPNSSTTARSAANLARIHDLAHLQADVLRRAAFADFWYRVTRRRVVGGPMAQRAQGHNAVLPHHFLTGV